MGPPRGSQNHLTHGLKTAAYKARRKEVNNVLRAARKAIRAPLSGFARSL
jgi:hypothetical protein